ncbi:hypothetical protein PBT90_06690 [Algoriphagus halophytocola]|uniref:hypothetical protein n=1 Tax=Algoriphagus halophytocola TaxID=2991499 RepID=UPI0022DE8313|nr:hypothetical protein [Algoriphagus sp. TR-M9]WBL44371.1 hypothetical protein PBT90_06690 [Algoriphagus sp. TR-M9]
MKVLFRIYLLFLFASYSHQAGEENCGFSSVNPNQGSNFAMVELSEQMDVTLLNEKRLRMKGDAALLAFPLQKKIPENSKDSDERKVDVLKPYNKSKPTE